MNDGEMMLDNKEGDFKVKFVEKQNGVTEESDYPRVALIKAKLKEAQMLVDDTQGRKRDGCFKIYKRIEICDLKNNISLYVLVKSETEREDFVGI